MYQKAVRVPMGDWADTRLKNLSDTDKLRDESKVNSGFGKKVDNWIGRELAYPTNVLHLADRDKESVDIPEELQDRIIKLLADLSYPTNVLHFATECGNKNHSAAFPENLPEWFIKLFTRKNGFVPQQSPPTVAATPSDTIVWVNIPTHIYHYPGSRYYGSTLNGKYMKEEDAINEGDRAGHSIYDRRNLQKK